jgi:serine/threonine-protein kinase
MPADLPDKGGRRLMRLGKYDVLARIGSGGMGAVYRALDTEVGREVALKVLSPEMAARPVMLERFRREARSAAKLRHENIVALYEFSEANGTHFLALEYVDGCDLHDFICRRGKLKPELARQILIQAARALAHAHQEGIVHRDIKPSNFLIRESEGRLLVKLADLGLAREASDDEFRLTRIGSTVGTVDYMSPEQARNSGSADIRSDLYSLGCTLFHMLTGKCPFPEGSLTERIYKHIEAEPPDVRTLNPNVPPGLAAVLKRLLQKQREDRYQTPADLLRELEDPQVLAFLTLAPAAPGPEAAEAPPGEAPPVRHRPPSTATLTLIPPAHGDCVVTEAAPAAPARPEPAPSRAEGRGSRIEDRKAAGGSHEDSFFLDPRSSILDPRSSKKSARRRTPRSGLLAWWRWGAVAAGLLVVAGALLALLGPSGSPNGTGPGSEPGRKGEGKGVRRGGSGPETPGKQGSPGEKGPEVKGPTPEEWARLRETFEGPLAGFPTPPPDAPVLRVSRSAPPGPASFRTLAEAWAAAPAGQHTVIEIRDSGPLFEPALPPAVGRSLTIRAAPGYRPLLAWEGAGATADRFLAVEKGSLTLEDLDVVMRWGDDRAERPAVLLAITGGNLAARGCTFSVAGKHPRGVEVMRLDTQDEPAQCRLTRCFVRGASLSGLVVRGAGAEVLLDGCLLVSAGDAALLDVQPHENGRCTLRMVRSTLVAGTNLLQVASPAGAAGRPAVNCLCWDSVLARPGPDVDGEMVRVAGAAGIGRMSWKAVNAFYAGWEKLLASAARDISAGEVGAWRETWGEGAASHVRAQPWPASLPAGLEESGPAAFGARDTPGFPTATRGTAPVGCDPASLPAGRPAWVGLTYDRFVPVPLTLPGDELAPPIPSSNDGRYHGGQVKLDARTPDLGQYLREQLQSLPPGPRVVLHVSGSGEFRTSPVELRGADLVVYFARPEKGAKPLTLRPNPRTTSRKPALFEVTGGSLEMSGVRATLENSALAAQPVRLVRVRGGQLRLFGCYLQGPLTKPPADYQGLIEFEGSAKEDPALAHGCALNECVLLSARALLTVRGTGARLLLHQCVLLAADDALRFEPGESPPARLNVACTLSRVSVAARRAAVSLKDAPEAPAGVEPVVIQADDCLFLDPFGDTPSRGCVLVYEGEALARGLLLWQGTGNGYDGKRLRAYAASESDALPARQAHAAWLQLWGKAGERHPRLIEWPATAGWVINADRPQLERLRLPPQVGTPVGADLTRLGILKKR